MPTMSSEVDEIYVIKYILSPFFFLDEPIPGTPRHVCESFVQIFEDLTA